MSTYVPIQAITLSSAVASVTFTGIPQTYTDLVLVSSAQRGITGSGGAGTMILNGDTGTNYSNTYLEGLSSAAGSGRDSNKAQINIGYSFDTNINTNILHFMNYSNTTTNKTVLMRSNNAGREVASIVGLWRSTAAITSISLTLLGGTTPNWATGSTFSLYGIAAA